LHFTPLLVFALSDIKVACHDAADSSTISRFAESTKKLIMQLQVRCTPFLLKKFSKLY